VGVGHSFDRSQQHLTGLQVLSSTRRGVQKHTQTHHLGAQTAGRSERPLIVVCIYPPGAYSHATFADDARRYTSSLPIPWLRSSQERPRMGDQLCCGRQAPASRSES
jgi:hypothetical protein